MYLSSNSLIDSDVNVSVKSYNTVWVWVSTNLSVKPSVLSSPSNLTIISSMFAIAGGCTTNNILSWVVIPCKVGSTKSKYWSFNVTLKTSVCDVLSFMVLVFPFVAS